MLKQILVSLSLTAGFILLPQIAYRQQAFLPTPTPTPTPILPTSTPTPIIGKTYYNAEFNYYFSYPTQFAIEDWNIGQAARIKNQDEGYIYQQVRLKSGADFFEVLVWANKNQIAVPQFLRWYRHEDLNLKLIPDSANFLLNAQPAYIFTQNETSRGKLNYLFVNYGQYLYEIVYPNRQTDADESFYPQMLSSFNFLPK